MIRVQLSMQGAASREFREIVDGDDDLQKLAQAVINVKQQIIQYTNSASEPPVSKKQKTEQEEDE
jgi:hypothetical protein